MLGKQWLNRYASTDIRGTAIDRSQNRQRKLDGIIAWYFDHVMETLPLMLQAALLLLGCALSRYLWEINVTLASVVISVTSFGVAIYLAIVVAGTTSKSCPYQTPLARILRHILPWALHAIRSAPSTILAFVSLKFSSLIQASALCSFRFSWNPEQPLCSTDNICNSLLILFLFFPLVLITLIFDVYQLGMVMCWLLVAFGRMVYHLFLSTSSQTHTLDLRCISWMLQTSLDKEVRLSTLKHLEPLIMVPTAFDPALVEYCFDVFIGCINTSDCNVVVLQGSEQLAMVSALCFFHTISHLSIINPASGVLKDVYHRYVKVFPADINFHGHEFSHIMNAVHRVFIQSVDRQHFMWEGYKPPSDEYAIIAKALVKLAQFGYQRTQQTKVPRLILRFALYSLSLDPPPPTPVIVHCLTIIAVDLDCDVSTVVAATLDEKCVHPSQIATTLTLDQHAGGGCFKPDNS